MPLSGKGFIIWKRYRHIFMIIFMLYKFTENKLLGQKLIATGYRQIIEIKPRSTPWSPLRKENLFTLCITVVRSLLKNKIKIPPSKDGGVDFSD